MALMGDLVAGASAYVNYAKLLLENVGDRVLGLLGEPTSVGIKAMGSPSVVALVALALLVACTTRFSRNWLKSWYVAPEADLILEGKRQMLDDIIMSFAPFAQRLEKGPTKSARRAAMLRLRVLIEMLEAPVVNQAFRKANWAWLARWTRGLADTEEAQQRLTIVFPTVCTAARVQRTENLRHTTDTTSALGYLASWCSDFLERPDVQSFLSNASPGSQVSNGPESSDDGAELSGEDIDRDKEESKEFRRRKYIGEENCWDDADATGMMIRGPTYLVDQRKIHSRSAMLDLVHSHLLKTDNEILHYSVNPRGRILQMRKNGDMRFFFTVNFRLSPIQFVNIWAIPKNADWFTKPEGILFQRFREMSDEERNQRVKVLLKVTEGPWMIRQGVPERPGVIGRKINVDYYQAHDHLELSVNCISSSAGRKITNLLTGAARHFAMELYVILEGQTEQELPERILGGMAMFHGDLSPLQYI